MAFMHILLVDVGWLGKYACIAPIVTTKGFCQCQESLNRTKQPMMTDSSRTGENVTNCHHTHWLLLVYARDCWCEKRKCKENWFLVLCNYKFRFLRSTYDVIRTNGKVIKYHEKFLPVDIYSIRESEAFEKSWRECFCTRWYGFVDYSWGEPYCVNLVKESEII